MLNSDLLPKRICQVSPHVSLVDDRLVERLLALYDDVLFVQVILEWVHLQRWLMIRSTLHVDLYDGSKDLYFQLTSSSRAASKQCPSHSHRPVPLRPDASIFTSSILPDLHRCCILFVHIVVRRLAQGQTSQLCLSHLKAFCTLYTKISRTRIKETLEETSLWNRYIKYSSWFHSLKVYKLEPLVYLCTTLTQLWCHRAPAQRWCLVGPLRIQSLRRLPRHWPLKLRPWSTRLSDKLNETKRQCGKKNVRVELIRI